MKFHNESLKEHGAGPLYSFSIKKNSRFSAGVRFSFGGYGWERPFYKPHYQHYKGTAMHFGIGPLCISFCF